MAVILHDLVGLLQGTMGVTTPTTGPTGPTYVALDAGLQRPTHRAGAGGHVAALAAAPSPVAPDPTALRALAEELCSARRPVMVLGYPGRDPDSFTHLVDLAELVGIGAVDTHWRLNFPTRHPLTVSDTDVVVDADCVLFVDVKDMVKPTHSIDRLARRVVSRLAPECRVLSLGYGDIGISSWSEDYSQQIPAHHAVVADTAVALPLLLEECRRLVASDDVERTAQRGEWTRALTELHDRTWAGGRSTLPTSRARPRWRRHSSPQRSGRSSGSTTGCSPRGPRRSGRSSCGTSTSPTGTPAGSSGTATQIGISLGVALAHKGTGRLVVDIQPDGDLMFDVGALWVASRYRLPMLVVMYNNRAYYNDWEHQERDRRTARHGPGRGARSAWRSTIPRPTSPPLAPGSAGTPRDRSTGPGRRRRRRTPRRGTSSWRTGGPASSTWSASPLTGSGVGVLSRTAGRLARRGGRRRRRAPRGPAP